MDRARAAPAATIERLYAAHITRALNLAYLVCGDRDTADDLAHDAFERAIGRLQHLRDPDSFWPYLRRTIVNLSASRWRRLRSERAALARHDARPSAQDPDSSIEEHDRLWQIVRSLPARQRTVLALRYFEDLSEQDAAFAMGCSLAAVRSLTTRALRAVRGHLIEEESS